VRTAAGRNQVVHSFSGQFHDQSLTRREGRKNPVVDTEGGRAESSLSDDRDRDAGARRERCDELCVTTLGCNDRESHSRNVNPKRTASYYCARPAHGRQGDGSDTTTSDYLRLASHHVEVAISAAAGIVITQATTILPATPQRTADTR
jgi:hypothetical protein